MARRVLPEERIRELSEKSQNGPGVNLRRTFFYFLLLAFRSPNAVSRAAAHGDFKHSLEVNAKGFTIEVGFASISGCAAKPLGPRLSECNVFAGTGTGGGSTISVDTRPKI